MLALSVGASELGTGAVIGLCYALLGIGLVLVYRTSRVIQLGYGEIGAFASLVLATAVVDHGTSWWVAFPIAVLVGAGTSALWELFVVRRLFDGPRLVLLAATIGISQVMFAAQLLIPKGARRGPAELFPTPFDLHVELGSFTLRGDHVLVLGFVPVVVVALGLLLNRTAWGLAIRGGAENADAAVLAGVPVRRVSTIVWAIAGGLSAATFVLILPVRGFVMGSSSQALGPGLLLRALAVALIGRMESLAAAVAGGLALGVFEATLLANVSSSRTVDVVLFLGVVGILLVRGSRGLAGEAGDALRGLARPRAGSVSTVVRRGSIGAALAVAVALPFVLASPGQQLRLATVAVLALVGISTSVITGWGGQLSLCQFAFVGCGAVLSAGLTARGMGFGWTIAYAAAACAVVATLIGLPALRIRGLFLAAVTLAFAVGASGAIFDREVFRTDAGTLTVPRSTLGPFDLADQRTYYFLCLGVLVACAAMFASLRRSGVGRSVIAVRENELAAASFGLSPQRVKLVAFALSGAVAGVAGALQGGLLVNLEPTMFGPERSFQVLAMTIIGGITTIGGAVAGAAFLEGVPLLFDDSLIARALTTGGGLLGVIVYVRGGLAEVAGSVARRLGGSSEPDEGAPSPDEDAPTFAPAPRPRLRAARRDPAADRPAGVALSCEGVDVRFGGILANAGIDLQVGFGETVGLVGNNGAGKSTLLNAISGFVPVDAGTILALGQDVTHLPAPARARLGVGRMFQQASLFGELTVTECVLVALEAQARTEVVPTVLHLPPARRLEAARLQLARELVDWNGLDRYRSTPVGRLSTGTRRIVELTCMVAASPKLLLLDEPTAGVAQREVEALAQRLLQVKDALGCSVVVIEHDMPLVTAICDRLVCLSTGTVIAEGAPVDVCADPAVIAAYLGTDQRAIRRSDTVGDRR